MDGDSLESRDMHIYADQCAPNTKMSRSRQDIRSASHASTGLERCGAGGRVQQPACLGSRRFDARRAAPIIELETLDLQQTKCLSSATLVGREESFSQTNGMN